MTSFSSIAPYFDLIFPYKKGKGDFLESLVNARPSSIIDIGCATGALIADLSQRGHKTVGVDLDDEMIRIAKESNEDSADGPDFFALNMMEIDRRFPSASFDLASCLGNTLPHLQSLDAILDFFRKVHKILRPGGKIAIQIVNYDRIMREKSGELPFIENDKIAFSRKYIFPGASPLVEFHTLIQDKRNNKEVANKSMLYPLLSGEMSSALRDAGFRNCAFYGDFSKIPYNPGESPALIAVGEKGRM